MAKFTFDWKASVTGKVTIEAENEEMARKTVDYRFAQHLHEILHDSEQVWWTGEVKTLEGEIVSFIAPYRVMKDAEWEHQFQLPDPGPRPMEDFVPPKELAGFVYPYDPKIICHQGYAWYPHQDESGRGIEIWMQPRGIPWRDQFWDAKLWSHDPGIYAEPDYTGPGPEGDKIPTKLGQAKSLRELFEQLNLILKEI